MTKYIPLTFYHFILGSFIALLISANTKAALYIGGGGALHRTSYTASNADGGAAASLLREYSMISGAANERFSFKGNKSELQDLIYSTYPEAQNDVGFFLPFSITSPGTLGIACVANYTIKDPSLYLITGNTCSRQNPNSSPAEIINLATAPNDIVLPLIEYDLGRAMGSFFMNQLKADLTLHFSSIEAQNNFLTTLGQKFLTSFTGTSNYTLDEVKAALSTSEMFDSAQSTLQLGILSPEEMLYQFQIFQEALAETLLDPSIINLSFSNASSEQTLEIASLQNPGYGTGLEAFLMAGMGKEMSKVYMGLEFALDMGKIKTGKNKNKEINLSSRYTVSMLYKLGYNFLPNSFNYLNIGLAIRDYKTQYNGENVSFYNSGLASHIIIGTGIEFFRKKNTSVFTELNYIISNSPIKTGSPDGKTLNVASTQIKVGFKYYLDQHPFLTIKSPGGQKTYI